MKTDHLVLLIPGNPSVPGIYDPFLDETVKQLDLKGSIHSKVLPHFGQCNTKEIKQKITIFDVINDHRNTVEQLIETYAPQNIILIGHSLGSGVTVELYQTFHQKINHFILLCPFLAPAPRNKNYLKKFKNPITRFAIKTGSHGILLNQKLAESFFKKWLGPNPFNAHIPKEIRKPYYIKNFFSLVSGYIDFFDQLELKKKMKQMDPDRCFFYFVEDDFWVPQDFQNFIPLDSRIIVHEGISHDFCLKKQEYNQVAKEIKNYFIDYEEKVKSKTTASELTY
jgi:pimeloyl-ACP methyl ester carboxylesterase